MFFIKQKLRLTESKLVVIELCKQSLICILGHDDSYFKTMEIKMEKHSTAADVISVTVSAIVMVCSVPEQYLIPYTPFHFNFGINITKRTDLWSIPTEYSKNYLSLRFTCSDNSHQFNVSPEENLKFSFTDPNGNIQASRFKELYALK